MKDAEMIKTKAKTQCPTGLGKWASEESRTSLEGVEARLRGTLNGFFADK
jgi:hypothetical protein